MTKLIISKVLLCKTCEKRFPDCQCPPAIRIRTARETAKERMLELPRSPIRAFERRYPVTVYLSPDVLEKAKRVAQAGGLSVSRLVEKIILQIQTEAS